ncbi:protein of unknown function [Vibrio tapetis subsp. tapetis]|uniref:Uncharacterized protein n=1 Tax=Vibrio tapetis subsp. tapetis TaxID=1671868 RepID=A0A2N8ZHW3_9VIBR|nr:protein of unknown function [Vibrio tapetis subsp. tapetis]
MINFYAFDNQGRICEKIECKKTVLFLPSRTICDDKSQIGRLGT